VAEVTLNTRCAAAGQALSVLVSRLLPLPSLLLLQSLTPCALSGQADWGCETLKVPDRHTVKPCLTLRFVSLNTTPSKAMALLASSTLRISRNA
jgi:hypothetical protein